MRSNQYLRVEKLISRNSHDGLICLAISLLIARLIGLTTKKYYNQQVKKRSKQIKLSPRIVREKQIIGYFKVSDALLGVQRLRESATFPSDWGLALRLTSYQQKWTCFPSRQLWWLSQPSEESKQSHLEEPIVEKNNQTINLRTL